MLYHSRKSIYIALLLLGISIISLIFTYILETDFNRTAISNIIVSPNGNLDPIKGKIYKPQNASDKSPVPGIIMVSNKNSYITDTSLAIELSRRGYVILNIICDPKTDNTIYVSDAYNHLIQQDYINSSAMSVIGSAKDVSAFFAFSQNPGGDILRSFIITDTYNNFSRINPKAFSDRNALFLIYPSLLVQPSDTNAASNESYYNTPEFFLNCKADEVSFNKVYGFFAEGTARKIEQYNTYRYFIFSNKHTIETITDWSGSSLGHPSNLYKDTDHIYVLYLASILLFYFLLFTTILILFMSIASSEVKKHRNSKAS